MAAFTKALCILMQCDLILEKQLHFLWTMFTYRAPALCSLCCTPFIYGMYRKTICCTTLVVIILKINYIKLKDNLSKPRCSVWLWISTTQYLPSGNTSDNKWYGFTFDWTLSNYLFIKLYFVKICPLWCSAGYCFCPTFTSIIHQWRIIRTSTDRQLLKVADAVK